MPPYTILALLLLGVVLAIIAHEAGHASMGAMVGMSPRIVSLGSGPPIYIARWRRLAIVVRPLLLRGHVAALAPRNQSRIARTAFFLGGVLGNGAAMSVLALVSAAWPARSGILATLGSMQLYVAVLALVPWPNKRGGSDGLEILKCLFRPKPEPFPEIYARMIGIFGPTSAGESEPSIDATEIVYFGARLVAATERWEREFAVDSLLNAIARGKLTAIEKLWLIDLLLSQELTFRHGYIGSAELDRLSLEALAIAPTVGGRVTRGGVLVALGRLEDARSSLLLALDEEMSDTNRMGCMIFLAQAAKSLGYTDEFERFWCDAMDLARRTGTDVNPELVENMIAAV